MEIKEEKNEILTSEIGNAESELENEDNVADFSEDEEISSEIKAKYENVYGELIQDAPLKEKLLGEWEFNESNALGFARASYFCVGELKIDSKGTSSEYSFRNGFAALKFCKAIRLLCSYSPEISFVDPTDRRKSRKFCISLPEKITFEILSRLGVISVNPKSGKIERMVSKIGQFPSEDYKSGFFFLIYLECGKLTYYGDYKLNFSLESELQAKKLVECFKREQFSAGLLQEKPILFLKGEQISYFIALLGASKEAVALTEYYCKRSATRLIRQDQNWKLANFDRQLTASANQIVAIKAIKDANKFGLLPDDLQELANLRLENPEMSILEVAKALGISKSTAYHRIERIIEFSKEINKK